MSLDDMNERMIAPTMPSALKGGLILGFVSIAISLVTYLTGNMTETWASWVGFPVVVYLIFFFQKKFRDEKQGGYITFGKAFGLGFLISLISTVVSSIYTFIVFSSDPSLLDQIMEKSYNDMVAQGMSDGQIEQAMEMSSMFMTPSAMTIMMIVFGAIFAVIISLITSAIVKRNHPLD